MNLSARAVFGGHTLFLENIPEVLDSEQPEGVMAMFLMACVPPVVIYSMKAPR
jgi:hypothetical protein